MSAQGCAPQAIVASLPQPLSHLYNPRDSACRMTPNSVPLSLPLDRIFSGLSRYIQIGIIES